MYVKICQKISKWFLRNNIISLDEREIFEFGFERILSIFFSSFLLLSLGLICGGFFESIVFFLCFYYARKYSGGYHADTYVKCNTYYLLTFFFTFVSYKMLVQSTYINVIMIGSAVIILTTTFLLAPINNPNNPILSGKENRYFILAILVNVLVLCLALLMKLLCVDMSVFVVLTLLMAAIYMHIEIIKRREWIMTKLIKNFSKKMANFAMKNARGSTREVSAGGIYQAKRPAILDKDSKK